MFETGILAIDVDSCVATAQSFINDYYSSGDLDMLVQAKAYLDQAVQMSGVEKE